MGQTVNSCTGAAVAPSFLVYCAVCVDVHGAALSTSNSVHTVRAEIDLSG